VNALLLKIALILCPADFRQGFREFRKTADETPENAFDIAGTGLTLRWELLQRDVSQAARSLLKAPLFTLVAVLAIALSVGANLIIASVVNTVVLRPLPFPQPNQLLFVSTTGARFGASMTYPQARVLQKRMHQIGDLALWAGETRTISGRGHAEAVQGATVTPNYFTTLGVLPALGRLFDASSTKADVVISYGLWLSKFGGDPKILGTSIRLNDDDYHIVGVTPAGFVDHARGGFVASTYWIPIDTHDPNAIGKAQYGYTGIARVRPGLDVNLRVPGLYDVQANDMHDVIVGPIRPLLWTLYAAVSLVLLIACINVANLHVSRHVAREGRFALLSALGATRRRIAIELATETALLAVIGGAAGLCNAWFGLEALGSIFAALTNASSGDIHLDRATLVYAVALVPFITIVSGLVPALTQRRNLNASLRSTTRGGQRRFAHRVRSALVVVEIALAMTLAICAGLIFHGFLTLTTLGLGFTTANVSVISSQIPKSPRYASMTALEAWVRKTVNALEAVPGVTSVSSATLVPFMGRATTSISFPGRPKSAINIPLAMDNIVTPEYFRTLQIPLIRGRLLSDGDRAGARSVAVIDVTFARQFFGTLDVVGRTFIPGIGAQPTTTIVGVVGNVRQDFTSLIQPTFYLSQEQFPSAATFIVRADQPITHFVQAVDAAFDHVDSSIPVPQARPLTDLIANQQYIEQTSLLLFGILAGIALVLSLTGVYAVSSNSVAQRRREFGIRKALGATTGVVLRSVVITSLRTSTVGIAIGIILAAVASRFLGTLLYHTSPWDPITFIGATVLFLLCAVVSAFIPALRAMRVDPAVALRSE
jgi:putative ABC transport system permease protein